MSENLPANLPVRQPGTVSSAKQPAEPSAAARRATHTLPSLPGMVLARRHLAHFIRFASRVTVKSATPGLRGCLFRADCVVVTDLDISLRTVLPSARDIGVVSPSTSSSAL
jgi:hypothetical protein